MADATEAITATLAFGRNAHDSNEKASSEGNSDEAFSELPRLDLNQNQLIQSQSCYRYTTGQSVGRSERRGGKIAGGYRPAKSGCLGRECVDPVTFIVSMGCLRWLCDEFDSRHFSEGDLAHADINGSWRPNGL